MDLIDFKYIDLVSTRLQKFKRVKDSLYNFRCFYCGDSKRTKNKARGYLYSIKNTFNYKCHNCGKSTSFVNFLKDVDPNIHDQYIIDRFKTNKKKEPVLKVEKKSSKPVFKKKYFDLPQLSKLNKEHFARQYAEKRGIPEKKLSELYFCEKFKEWTNTQKPTFKSLEYDEPRIIIPLIYNDEIFGFQGRSLSKNSKVKYITIILDDSIPKIYGLDGIDWSKNVYVVEGPIDSMFIPNAIAMVGADVNISQIPDRKDIDYIFVYDNEKRNKEIVDRMQKTISQGHYIVIWPNDLKEKDINDMILAGLPVEEIIKENTFMGLEAKAKLIGWKRV